MLAADLPSAIKCRTMFARDSVVIIIPVRGCCSMDTRLLKNWVNTATY